MWVGQLVCIGPDGARLSQAIGTVEDRSRVRKTLLDAQAERLRSTQPVSHRPCPVYVLGTLTQGYGLGFIMDQNPCAAVRLYIWPTLYQPLERTKIGPKRQQRSIATFSYVITCVDKVGMGRH